VFLATKDLGADVRTYKGRKPPKHYPDHIPMMRLDDAYSHSDEWKGTLHDTIAAGRPVSDAEKQHRLIRDAAAAERPFLSKNEMPVLDCGGNGGGSQAESSGPEANASMRAAITKSDSCKPPIFRVVNVTSQKPHPNVSSGWCQISSASAITALANANAVR
jgi:hypothetical protein